VVGGLANSLAFVCDILNGISLYCSGVATDSVVRMIKYPVLFKLLI
jgi:hypothetical protein